MEALIREAGRQPAQRTTLYGEADPARVRASHRAAPLSAVVQTPLRERHAHSVAR
jgi:hypothetical protein